MSRVSLSVKIITLTFLHCFVQIYNFFFRQSFHFVEMTSVQNKMKLNDSSFFQDELYLLLERKLSYP